MDGDGEFSQEFTEATDDDRRAAHSEGDIANRFSIKHPHTRFCHDWGRWIEWTGTHWQIDRTTQVYDMIHAICAKLSAIANSGGKQLGSSRTVAGAERIAKSDRRHAITSEILDADPWLMNTPDGTVDLRTGEAGPNRPEAFITKITAVG